MTDGRADVSRRGFLRTAAGATAASAAAGTATAQEGTEGGGGGPPDFGGFLDQVGNYDGSVADATGQDTATVEVGVQANGGAFGFGPPAIHVDNGATVQFEWTGNGGGHNVVSDGEGPLDSGSAVSSAGVNYEHTFEEDGIYPYVCVPHEGLGMKGAIVVGTDYPTKSSGGGGGGSGSSGPPEVPNSAKTLGVATSFVMVATLGLAYFFIRYGGDYETPE
ncbi:halocyanin-like protein [Haloarcula quadrata]|jgi:halocyanin-like protein|uniref:Halocyanin domain-containing protein n=4 Tax=Haloarcula TaxID=2237 RepID=Q5UXI4_HALMA|nr:MULTISPECIES: halocyanin domain-containing protein [Haloarcula]AAV48019.1 halocyanin precursor-like [Haloarcula marismortui ATCC 43049]EMA12873.1 halocyanin-like protein [Haloarcula sinaiiensis ATCC 33800]EMA17547.1 halocyanin-like protein [Haloarcula californiae ATCC 33799]NHN63728.1 halocyanin domain-containing protein [Haloarcula sp. JP-Z28]QCP92690.1 halocyanin domain-containing protein [Haloarcula marismortui ATCC 43049]